MRGGEPVWAAPGVRSLTIFPTCVGVNRRGRERHGPRWHFPHMRGGEPSSAAGGLYQSTFSPHAWG